MSEDKLPMDETYVQTVLSLYGDLKSVVKLLLQEYNTVNLIREIEQQSVGLIVAMWDAEQLSDQFERKIDPVWLDENRDEFLDYLLDYENDIIDDWLDTNNVPFDNDTRLGNLGD